MTNSYINEIKIEGLGIFKDEIVEKDLKPNFNLILGKRESGKSTKINSTLWNLFNYKVDNLKSFLDAKKYYNQIGISVKNKKYSIKKEISKFSNSETTKYENKDKDLEDYLILLNNFKSFLYINDHNINNLKHPIDIIKNFNNLNLKPNTSKILTNIERDYNTKIDHHITEEEINRDIENFKKEISKLEDLLKEEEINNSSILEYQNKINLTKNKIKEIGKEEEISNKIYDLNMKIELLKEKISNKLNSKNNNHNINTKDIADKILSYIGENNRFKDFYYDKHEYNAISSLFNYINTYNLYQLENLHINENYLIDKIQEIKMSNSKKISSILKKEKNTDNGKTLLYFFEKLENNLLDTLDIIVLFHQLKNNKTYDNMKNFYKTETLNETFEKDKDKLYFTYSKINKEFKKLSGDKELKEEIINIINNNVNSENSENSENGKHDERDLEELVSELNSLFIKLNKEEYEYSSLKENNDKLKELEEKLNKYMLKKEKINIYKKNNLSFSEMIENITTEHNFNIEKKFKLLKIKNEYENSVKNIETNFYEYKRNLDNNYLTYLNNYISNFNNNYSISFVDDQIFFNDGNTNLPLNISKKEHKIIYKIALAILLNEYFKLIEQNILLFIDNVEDLLVSFDINDLIGYMKNIKDFQIILTKRIS